VSDHRSIALGVSVPGYPADRRGLDAYLELAGKPPAILHWFQRFARGAGFQADAAAAAHRLGAVPMVSWEPWQGLEAIADGSWDHEVRAWAAGAAAFGHPVLLRFAHEMNAPGIPWFGPPVPYLAAWRRLRSLFGEVGAANVRFVWCPYVLDRGVRPFAPYYPGHDAVDWVALDGYNWGRLRFRRRWRSFDAVFAASYAELRTLGPSKPLMLAEVATADVGGDKAAWIRSALLDAVPARYPTIGAVVWFHRNRPDHADWRLDSSPAAAQAWRDVVADARYQGSL
jgi:hypothetical protein